MITPFKRTGILKVGHEYPPKWETAYFQTMIEEMKEEMREMYPEGEMKRQAHTKMHGLLKAEFEIETDLPEYLKVGVFKEPKKYGAFVRFSNSSTSIKPDVVKDIRGMAIKIVGVEGEKLLTEGAHALTQDFVLISNQTFIAKNVKQFSRAIKALTSTGILKMLVFVINPLNWGVIIRSKKAMIKVGSVLEIPFYSSTPYQFDAENMAVKYMCMPQNPKHIPVPDNPHHDFLKYQMISHLKKSEKVFDFFVQFQKNAYKMPIEDPTVKWDSEPIKVATLRIPTQDFDTDERTGYGENLSFTPWHSLPQHRPLGGFNRARRWVYESMAEFRHQKNGVHYSEPVNMNVPNEK
ncbi:MAG: catalase family protein [Bacteroidia bacterium]|nr:catalase family protein [Bacteroidia bacterium]